MPSPILRRQLRQPVSSGGPVTATAAARSKSWVRQLAALIAAVSRRSKVDGRYAHANRDSVARAISGRDPFTGSIHAGSGAHMVVNLSSAHVPAFCAESSGGPNPPYKNCYDLALSGDGRVSRDRRLVDESLPVADYQSTYFGAVEVNGAGIRFYGDMCLVLRDIDPGTMVLDRNSFELLRSPVSDDIRSAPPAAQPGERRRTVSSWSGRWVPDLPIMTGIKVMRSVVSRDRRWTMGQISRSVRDDEDYIEVLKQGSFGASDLKEARVAAGDAAYDALVTSRLAQGPMPRIESLIWRNRRSRAERALRALGIPVRVVTTSGRARD
ncbi:MAG: hypothetical protein IAE86_20815 [Burkholderiaceae bacterium]|nr:hypothetical protein [Burkholderiaceae bacterium]